MTSSSYEKALKFALKWEGGYSNHPSDTGGETNKGITHAVYDQYRRSKNLKTRSVRLLAEEELQEIYKQQYWYAAKCDLLPEKLAICHFDWAVNAGVHRAVKTLQQCVGTTADGVFGRLTQQAVDAAITTHGEDWTCQRYCQIREGCYRRWGIGSQSAFLGGWLNRLNSLRKAVGLA